jgi:hypothetical protein
MRQQPAAALAGVQMGAVPDAAFLQGLARAVEQLLAASTAAGDAPEERCLAADSSALILQSHAGFYDSFVAHA